MNDELVKEIVNFINHGESLDVAIEVLKLCHKELITMENTIE